jgi:sugar/nucleoside kinase (ribokinase family)
MSFDVVVIGNAGIDTNVYLKGDDIDYNVEANFTENLDTVGQAGGYAARGYAQRGRKTAFIGTVGQDYSGKYLLEVLHKDGIDTSGVWIDPAGTSRSVNIMYRDGRCKNFFDGKSHMVLQPDVTKCEEIFAGAKLAHFNIPNWARTLLPVAKKAGAKIAVDIQDVVDVHDPYRQDFIKYADILFFSAVNYSDPNPVMQEFLKINPNLLMVCGMGVKGCGLGTKTGVRFFPPVQMQKPVVDTNGAGDALAVGFLDSYVLENRSLEKAIRLGQIAARYTCTLRGTSDRLINRDQLEKLSHE